ncbi:MAG: hemolysin III family protein [Actinobacteria bacterium]|nr:hemolysin III family protein [Actinomycetota bacterium]
MAAAVEAVRPTDPLVKPRLRGVSHQIAFFVALVMGPLLIVEAPTMKARFLVTVYVVCLASLFGVSALFHRVTWSPAARRRMRRLDHSMIFLFIAGTYTPVAGLVLLDGFNAWVLPTVWLLALTGVFLKLVWLDAPKPLSAAMYIGVGWAAVLALPALFVAFGAVGFALLFAGGVLYTLGAIVYARRSPDPAPAVFGYHEIFHLFVIAAAILHFLVIAFWALPRS